MIVRRLGEASLKFLGVFCVRLPAHPLCQQAGVAAPQTLESAGGTQ